MITKDMDEYAAELATIERLVNSDPAEPISLSLQKDRTAILRRLKHQRDATYHLDFYFKESPDWTLLHDLSLEMDDQSEQFDHLLIGRQLDIYVIDTRHYNADVRFDEDGNFQYIIDKKPISVASPLLANQRRAEFLQRYLADNGLLPHRLGLTIKPRIHSVVAVSPTSRVTAPKGCSEEACGVLRMDRFLLAFKKAQHEFPLSDFVNLARQLSPEALAGLSAKLSQRHIPRSVDYAGRYGLKHEDDLNSASCGCDEECRCAMCQKRITSRVARYCYTNRELFSGKVYCFSCQRSITLQVGNG